MPFKAAGNVTVTFDSLDTTDYLNQTSLDAVVAQAEVTDFNSDGQEQIPTLGDWSIPVGGPWAKALDDKMGAAAVTPPAGSALKTLAVAVTDGVNTVTYTWTTNAFVADYHIMFDNPTSAIMWSGTLKGSGAPGRAVT